MSLYEREYIKDHRKEKVGVVTNDSPLALFIQRTYQYFAGSLLVGAVGAYVGMGIPAIADFYWGLVILEFALIFGMMFARNKPGLSTFMLFAFSLVSGLTLSVVLAHFIGSGGGTIVANAFILSTVAFGGLSIFAMNTDRDFTGIGKFLFVTLLVVVVGSLLNVFFFHNPWTSMIISMVSTILFSAFILYDTQNIIRGNYGTPVEGALALYLDFLNLFTSLLNVLGFMSSED